MVCLRWRTSHRALSPQRGLFLCLKKPADSSEFHLIETCLHLNGGLKGWPGLLLASPSPSGGLSLTEP